MENVVHRKHSTARGVGASGSIDFAGLATSTVGREYTTSAVVATIPTPSHQRQATAPSGWLERCYPMPTIYDTIQEFARVDMRLLYDDRPHPWLIERRAAVQGALLGKG